MRFTEINVFGVFVSPMSVMLLAAWVVVHLLHRMADRTGLWRHLWHPRLGQRGHLRHRAVRHRYLRGTIGGGHMPDTNPPDTNAPDTGPPDTSPHAKLLSHDAALALAPPPPWRLAAPGAGPAHAHADRRRVRWRLGRVAGLCRPRPGPATARCAPTS